MLSLKGMLAMIKKKIKIEIKTPNIKKVQISGSKLSTELTTKGNYECDVIDIKKN